MSKTVHDDPACDHLEMQRRVTNLPDGEDFRSRPAHRSVWVCDSRPCVLDAMAWVERGTGDTAIIYDDNRREVKL